MMVRSRSIGLLLVVGLALGLGPGCAKRARTTAPQELNDDDYPGTLVDTGQVARAFSARQVLEAEFQGRRRELEMALELRDDTLRVVGIAPWGGVAFVITQTGSQVSFDDRLPPGVEMPFPPSFILKDIGRVMFFDARLPWGTEGADGRLSHEVDGELVEERWSEGRLLTRTFERREGGPEGRIVVEYEGGMVDARPPEWITLRNEWFGYELRVHTLSFAAG